MKRILGLLLTLSAALIFSGCQESLQIPTPKQMAADIEVKGRLSTLKNLDIQYLGKRIPYTYSDKKIANSPGYFWWVSKHFAIKSDLPEHKVKLYLELLELSYPHYVSLFGAEPANIENQRIAVVYGASRESIKSTMLDDGFTRGVHKTAGGETMYYNRAGYSFPSHREQHQRYIVIHETMHAFHMALTGHSTWAPNWITEGLADSIASHVYYPDTKTLAVMVFDRAPMNYITSGLKQYIKGGKPSIEQINNDPALKRGLNFFIIHFLLSDPERAHHFSLFRDRLMAANPHSEATLPTASRLLKETFTNWQRLESEFANFVADVYPSFMIANGPWEQDGDKYWIRTYKHETPARLDIRVSPKNNGIKFDFPQPQPSALITDPENLMAGAVVDFAAEHLSRGSVGLGLGVNYSDNNQAYFNTYENKYQSAEDSYISVLVDQARKVTISGVNLNFNPQSYALKPALVRAISKELNLGIATKLTGDQLQLRLASQTQEQIITLQLNKDLLNSFNSENFALLANNNSHRLTPYFQSQPNTQDYYALPDRKQWTSNTKLYRMFKTCKEYKLSCPERLTASIAQLAQKQDVNIETLHAQVLALISNNPKALMSLSGLQFHLVHDKRGLRQEIDVPNDTSANVNNKFTWWQAETELESFSQLKRVSTGSQQLAIRTNNQADKLTVRSDIEWHGYKFSFSQSTNKQGFDGVYLAPEYRLQDGQLHVFATLTGPYSGDTGGTITFELLPNKGSETRISQRVTLSPYESKTWQQSFSVPEVFSDSQAVEVTADLVVDGEGVLLSEMIYLSN